MSQKSNLNKTNDNQLLLQESDDSRKAEDYKAAAQIQQLISGFSIPAAAKDQAVRNMKSSLSTKYSRPIKIDHSDADDKSEVSAMIEPRSESLNLLAEDSGNRSSSVHVEKTGHSSSSLLPKKQFIEPSEDANKSGRFGKESKTQSGFGSSVMSD